MDGRLGEFTHDETDDHPDPRDVRERRPCVNEHADGEPDARDARCVQSGFFAADFDVASKAISGIYI